MNEIIEHCMYESGLTADGCWNQLDDYAKEAIERFAKLIVRECAEYAERTGILNDADYEGEMIADAIKEHFGVNLRE